MIGFVVAWAAFVLSDFARYLLGIWTAADFWAAFLGTTIVAVIFMACYQVAFPEEGR